MNLRSAFLPLSWLAAALALACSAAHAAPADSSPSAAKAKPAAAAPGGKTPAAEPDTLVASARAFINAYNRLLIERGAAAQGALAG